MLSAKDLIKPDTPEYFHTAFCQHSCLQLEMISSYDSDLPEEEEGSLTENLLQTLTNVRQYPEFLNEDGMKIFQEAQDRYNQGETKDTISNVGLRFVRAGMWVADKESKYFKPDGIGGIMCSWKNVIVIGKRESDSVDIQTSVVVFLTSEWCYTVSGSIYKLQF